jgi:hypothetical protein
VFRSIDIDSEEPEELSELPFGSEEKIVDEKFE